MNLRARARVVLVWSVKAALGPLVLFLGLWAADLGGASGHVGRCGPFGSDRALVISGLRASAPVSLRLRLGSREGPYRVRVRAARAVAEVRLTQTPAEVELATSTDSAGQIGVRFEGVRWPDVLVRVHSVTIRHLGRGHVPLTRLWQYGLIGLCASILLRRRVPPKTALVWLAGGLLPLATALAIWRCQLLPNLPWLTVGLGGWVAWLWLTGGLTRWLEIPCIAGRCFAFALLLRLGLALTPGCVGIDLVFHVHRLVQFKSGELTQSAAPGFERVPYPPALYALLSFFSGDSFASNLMLMRLALGFCEGTAPLVIWAIARATGLRRAAHWALAAAAALPEGVLVLAKGIGANIFGTYMTLLAVWGLVSGVPAVVAIGLLAVLLLSHAPAAATAVTMLLVWWGWQYRCGELDRRGLMRRWVWLLLASSCAWLVYYRESGLVFGAGHPGPGPAGNAVYVRWYRVLKVLQDTVLKFGLGPLMLAAWGAWRGVPRPLATLLKAWLVTGGAFGLLALCSPFPLRFEYFLTPAIALLAGVGAQRLQEQGKGRWALGAVVLGLLVQTLVGLAYLTGRLETIAAVMESPRRPFFWRF